MNAVLAYLALVLVFGSAAPRSKPDANSAQANSKITSRTPGVKITSPVDGSVVHPGETITVSVTATAESPAVKAVAIIGQDPIGFAQVATPLPASISLVIPPVNRAGLYSLTAVAATPTGVLESESIEIDVESAELPTSLSTPFEHIDLETQGEEWPIQLEAEFPEKKYMTVAESSNVVFESSNAEVATVNNFGMITAVAAGTAAITASYRNSGGEIVAKTHIRLTVGPFLVSPCPAKLKFDETRVGGFDSQKLTITNSGKSPFQVLKVFAGNDFSEKDDCVASSPIFPGNSCFITVTFAPKNVGPQSGAVSVTVDNESLPTVVTLSGIGVQ
jgi:hypothetical protein